MSSLLSWGFTPTVLIVILLLSLAASVWLLLLSWSAHHQARIPGPNSFWASVKLLILKHSPASTLQDWASHYGGLFGFRLGDKPFIVISDHQIALDILVSKASWTSSRLELSITSEALWAGMGIINTTDNEVWRKHRRIMQHLLTSKAITEYLPLIRRQADHLLIDLSLTSRSLGEIEDILDVYVVELALDLLLGAYHCHRNEAAELLPLIKSVERSMRHLKYSIVELVPSLWFLPSREEKNVCLRLRMVESFRKILSRADPDYVKLLSLQEQARLNDVEVALLSAAFVIGAHVSTVPILHSCVENLSTRPYIQHRIHAEIDQRKGEVGRPDIEDEEWLPFSSALIKELLRCQKPFVHMPHVASESFNYRGMNIPKGTAIILNAWAINHDPQQFADPNDFQPSRHFIADSESRQNDVGGRQFWAFGSGY